MQERTLKKVSIMRKMLLPMILVMLVQAVLFASTILWGGIVDQLNHNAFDILNERVINRKNYIQNEMIQRWSNLDESMERVQSSIHTTLASNSAALSDIHTNGDLATEILEEVSQDIVYLLRKNSVTGAFIVLNGQTDDAQSPQILQKSGLWIRDLDPLATPDSESDLLIERAPSALTQALSISMDTRWRPQFEFVGDVSQQKYSFYFNPLKAAENYPNVEFKDLGYWSLPFRLSGDDVEIITYSVPILDEAGNAFGVLGIEITTDYLRSLLPYKEISSEQKGAYLLGVDSQASMNFSTVLASGPVFKQYFGDQQDVRLLSNETYNNSYRFENTQRMHEPTYGCVQYIQLYNTNTPFEQDRWALIGIMAQSDLLSFSQGVRASVVTATLVSLLIGLMGIYIVSKRFAGPIISLSAKVRQSDPSRPVQLEQTHIVEIDNLATAIEHLSSSVADSASKLSQIIEMADIPIGAFDYDIAAQRVFHTNRFFELLGIDDVPSTDVYMDWKVFEQKLASLKDYTEQGDMNRDTFLFKIPRGNGLHAWIRLKLVKENGRILGVVNDITQEMVERRKIEYERDYDLLTNLLNRRAFQVQMQKIFSQPEILRTAALIMLDLDDLKFINDTYGHDYGDEYIRCTAYALKKYAPYRSILARMSGDEFYIFIYGYDTKQTIRRVIDYIKRGVRETVFPLPDDHLLKIRASAGVAWYPSDSESYEQLIRYADFAMYEVKNSTKGEFKEFDLSTYHKDSYLLHNKEELNQLIDGQLVDYYFQPIIDARTGELYAYEALMRSRVKSLRSPNEILTLAKAQSKLNRIERITWFKALEAFDRNQAAVGQAKLFINSIPSQLLSDEDMERFESTYSKYLQRLVLEITEGERFDAVYTTQKKERLRAWGGGIALDDYGTGYNSEVALLSLEPDYVKIDMSIVRNIDVDENRLEIFQNLVSYSRQRGIKVIAEGVETKGELETLIANGVDYVQGFYIGIPEYIPSDIPHTIRMEIVRMNERK